MNPLQTVENIENQMHSQDKAQQCIFCPFTLIHLVLEDKDGFGYI